MKTNNKYKTLAFNTTVFAIGSFGAKLLSILLTKLFTANLPEAHFNTKEVLENIANILIPIISLSVFDAIIRFGLDKDYENKTVFSNAVTLLLCGSGVFLLFSPLLLLYPDIRQFVPLLILYILCSCFRQLSTQFARARGKVKLFAADGIYCTLLFFIFNIILVGKLQLDIAGCMIANAAADFISGVTVWIIAGHGKYYSPKYVDKKLLRTMVRFSVPLIPTAVLWIITGFSDRLFVRHMVDADSAGVYGVSTKIPNLLSMVSTIVYQAWNMSAIAENDSEGRSKFYTQVFEAYQAILTVAAGGILAFDRFLSGILIDYNKFPAYERAYLYTPVLIIAVQMLCYNQFLSSIYTVTKHTKGSLWTSVAAAGLNLLLNTLLIPTYGVNGAIAATFASYFVCYVLRIFDARRYIPFEVSHLRFIVNTVILFIMCFFVHMTDPEIEHQTDFWAKAQLFLFGFLLLLTAINLKPLLTTAKKILKR